MRSIDTHKPWVVLPLKSVKKSNSRLTPILSRTERQQLSLIMLGDVLHVLRNATDLGGLVVVTNCPIVKTYFDKLEVTVLEEGARPELNSAISKAVQFLEELGVRTFFTIPGDVPSIDVAEISQLIACVRRNKGVTLVPSHDGVGTNSIASSIPIKITTQFGMDSLSAHRHIAKHWGLSIDVLPLAGLGFDIDWPGDLLEFASLGGNSKTHKYLSDINLVQRQLGSELLDLSNKTWIEKPV